jgi:hypothetical protein
VQLIGGKNEKGIHYIINAFDAKKALAFELNLDGSRPRNE